MIANIDLSIHLNMAGKYEEALTRLREDRIRCSTTEVLQILVDLYGDVGAFIKLLELIAPGEVEED